MYIISSFNRYSAMDSIEVIVCIGVIWNAILQTVWFWRTKDKH